MLSSILNSVSFFKPYAVSKLDGAVLCQVSPHARWQKTAHWIAAEILDGLNEMNRPGYVIIDLTHNMPGIEDLIITFNSYVRGSRAWLRHPNLKEFVIIACDSVVNTPFREMRKIQLGDISIRVFTRLETALDFIHQPSS